VVKLGAEVPQQEVRMKINYESVTDSIIKEMEADAVLAKTVEHAA
jgi:hypothetical protein